MFKPIITTLVLLLSSIQLSFGAPLKVILDTDMGNDVDDALALAMIHSLQNRGEAELLAVTVTKDHPEVVPYIDAINTFYGRGDIPVATYNSGVTTNKSKFTGIINEQSEGRAVFPYLLPEKDQHLDATTLLRKTLAAEPDQSVVIIQVGFSSNLARLLTTKGDQFSTLNGRQLVAIKVKFISIMAGAFSPISGKTHLEYNVTKDIPAAQQLANNWPTPFIWSGFEIGLAIRYPAYSIKNDFKYIARHPIPESYQLYKPTPHERPSWDLTSVIYAIRPKSDYFQLSPPGQVIVLDNGKTTFQPDESGHHRYLQLQESNIPRIKEMMTLLVSEPPQTKPAN